LDSFRAAETAVLAPTANGSLLPLSVEYGVSQALLRDVGRSNWLFAGSLRAGKHVAAIMSLLHSTGINGHDPYAYFKDALDRLPTHPASKIDQLLPHQWVHAREV
jgi:transposase